MKKQHIYILFLQIWIVATTNIFVCGSLFAQITTIEIDSVFDLSIDRTIKIEDSLYFFGDNSFPNYLCFTKTSLSFQGFMENMKKIEKKGYYVRFLDAILLENGNFMLLADCIISGVRKKGWKLREEKRGLIMVIDKAGNLLFEHLYLGYMPHSLSRLGKNTLLFIYREKNDDDDSQSQLYTILLDINGRMILENFISDVCERIIYPIDKPELPYNYVGILEADTKTPQSFNNCYNQNTNVKKDNPATRPKFYAHHLIQFDSLGALSKKIIIPSRMPNNEKSNDGTYFMRADGFIYVFTPYKPKDEFFTPRGQNEFHNLRKGTIPFKNVKSYITKVNPENFTTIANYQTEMEAMPYWIKDINDKNLPYPEQDYIYSFTYSIGTQFLDDSFIFIHTDKLGENVYFQQIDTKGKILAQKKVNVIELLTKETERILGQSLTNEEFMHTFGYIHIDKNTILFICDGFSKFKEKGKKQRRFLQFFSVKLDPRLP